MTAKIITQDRLKELLYYNKQLGVFVWKKTNSNRARVGSIAGSATHSGYMRIKVDKVENQAHRLVFLYINGALPEARIDHINGVRDDNSLSNLRLASQSENMRNTAISKRNASGIIGLSWHKKGEKWQVQITHKHLGLFSDFFEACCARKSAEVEYGYHPNHGRSRILPVG